MTEKVLFVDDEPNVLSAYKRALRRQFTIDTCESGADALEAIEATGPYAVIVSDMRMPEMNGVELLTRVKTLAPDTVRMMLTGNSDQQTAIDAVNEGDIFRFLNKPCPPEDLARALTAGLEQHRLITVEKELLERTLKGSLEALSEVLALAKPRAFGRTTRLKQVARSVAAEMALDEAWWLDSLVMMSQIGCVTLSDALIEKTISGQPLSADESTEFANHPVVGSELLARIPRLESIAESIRYQERHFDGSGTPASGPKGADLPLGARLLKCVHDFDRYSTNNRSACDAIARLKAHADRYDPDILAALERALGTDVPATPTEVSIDALKDGMLLAMDVVTNDGTLLVVEGQETTASVRRRLLNFSDNKRIGDKVMVIDSRSHAQPAIAAAG